MASELKYTVLLLPEPEGGFTVRVPALPAVVSYGTDEADALHMAREAIELILEVLRDDGEDPPPDVVPLIRQVTVTV